jgi:GntR family transcriptional regulator
MGLHLDLVRSSPVPLYHQIAEAIRYRIATGALSPGAALPPLRDAAVQWSVNLHTVRRAYVELAREGLVATQVPHGTVILPGAARPADAGGGTPALDLFVERVAREAKQKHGLTLDQLAGLLERRHALSSAPSAHPVVHVVECSETQSADLAAQLAERWRATAIPWPLGRPAPPGRGPVVATYFHYSDIRASWPDRIGDVHFMGIRLDPAVRARLERHVGRAREKIAVVFYEREESMLHSIATDLARMLPAARFRIVPRLTTRPAAELSRYRGKGPLLFSPRVWGDLPAALRSDPRMFESRYVFENRDLEAIGPALHWRPQ